MATREGSKTVWHRLWILAIIVACCAIAAPFLLAFALSSNVLRTSLYIQTSSSPSAGLAHPDMSRRYWHFMRFYQDPKTDLGLGFENVEFPTEENLTLRGWLVPAPNNSTDVGIALVHGAFADRRDVFRHVSYFHNEGAVLLFDVRDHGISDGFHRGTSLGIREHVDVRSAVHFLKTRGFKKIIVFGTSNGASSSILAAASEPAIDCVIAENPFASRSEIIRYAVHEAIHRAGWGTEKLSHSFVGAIVESVKHHIPDAVFELVVQMALLRMGQYDIGFQNSSLVAHQQKDAIDVIANISPRPIFLLHGTADEQVPSSHSSRLFEKALEPKLFWLAEGAEHGYIENKHPEEFKRRVLDFIRQYC